MQFNQPVSVKEIATLIQATLIGNTDAYATGINEIHRVRQGDLIFVDHPKYYDTCIYSNASFIIINKVVDVPAGKCLLVVEDPFEAYQTIVTHFLPFVPQRNLLADDVIVGEGSVIMPGTFIGPRVVIGANCTIHPGVHILGDTIIENDVIIQSGTVIGSDAFYYNKKTNRNIQYKKMLSCGRVVLEQGVEIGAHCTIDRGVSDETRIGAGTKLDNLVHIGHDTIIGKNCLIAAQVGIAGASILEDNVILWGQVGVNKTTRIKAGAIVNGQSGVISDLTGNTTYFGTPALPAREKLKETIWLKRLPQLWDKVMGR